jgi:hypothetical protein
MSDLLNTFGVFNIETKELFKFTEFTEAYRAYFSLLVDSMKDDRSMLDKWYIVYIKNSKIVQFEKIKWDAHCHPGVDINELSEFEKPNNW